MFERPPSLNDDARLQVIAAAKKEHDLLAD